jgi:hypothetical protein
MKFINPMLAAAAMFLAAGAVACSSDLVGPPAIDDAQINADVAATSGDAVASEIASFSDNITAAGSFTMVAPSYNVSAPGNGTSGQPSFGAISPTCTFAAGRYTCSAATEQGLNVTRSFAFYDAAGQSLQVFDSTKVESGNFQAQIDGSFQRDLVWTAGVHRTRNNTVSGLISMKPQRKWNGVGSGADTVSHIGLDGIRTLAGNAVDTVTNVVMPGKDAGNKIPLTGTIVIVADYTASLLGAAGTASTQVTRRVVVTFNGTVTPTLQIGNMTCTLHLDTHTVDGCQ